MELREENSMLHARLAGVDEARNKAHAAEVSERWRYGTGQGQREVAQFCSCYSTVMIPQ